MSHFVNPANPPMLSECSAEKFELGDAGGRTGLAGFDGGAITSDAGALLRRATDRAVLLMDCSARCAGSASPIASSREPRAAQTTQVAIPGSTPIALASLLSIPSTASITASTVSSENHSRNVG
ncbi:MAG TPA: hypothetical protein PK677_09490 [Acidiphilium sp.]|nr:MAG: hypothetical protein B7Z67_12180 [Acidiphilium sp. 21-60-14]OYV89614.1 MAG: hypothetical protein B7Z57_12055 [Acidiphilium sp. 37-60-79]OZB39347.1 MAG: hypothetical protein B7X48_09350 [Acidiphilium sp. 34-60-192]HQT88769.1 hypothetical protein [Acidiphilium sp.]